VRTYAREDERKYGNIFPCVGARIIRGGKQPSTCQGWAYVVRPLWDF